MIVFNLDTPSYDFGYVHRELVEESEDSFLWGGFSWSVGSRVRYIRK